MNRTQLDALLAAGLIGAAAHQAAIANLGHQDAALPTLSLELDAASVRLELEPDPESDDDAPKSGILTGDIVRYDELIPSHGLNIHAGALTMRQPLDVVKMLRDHDMAQPVGYLLEHDPDVVQASFQIAPSELPRVVQEFEDKLRDRLSVGFTISEYEIDDDWILHVLAGEIHEVSLCAVPAVATAGVISVAAAMATNRKEHRTMNRAQIAAALAAGSITQAQADAAIATLDVVSAFGPAADAPVPLAVAAGPELQTSQPAPVVVKERRSLKAVTKTLVDAANTGNPAAFQLALADIIPTDDAGAAFLREDWQGEAWRDDNENRPWIDAFGPVAELTALKGKGWEWGTADVNGDGGPPLVDEYAGNKTEVPTNEIGTAPKTYDGFRIAAGWDVDRAFTDFAAEEFWASFWPATIRDYKKKSNIGIRTRVLAKASAPAGTVATGGVKAVLKQLVRDVRPYGKANRIFLGDDLFSELEDLSTEDLPLWLKSATVGLDIAEGSADVGTIRILLDSGLAAKQGVAFDSRAGKVREKSPFRVTAENIPNGGIDVGIFSYLRFDDYDKRAIVKRTYVPAP